MIKPKYLFMFFGALALLLIAGCAAGPNPSANVVPADGELAGFWLGVWHGMIAPITFIISLFKPNVHFYEVHNNGNIYNLGFMFGLLICGT